MPYQAKKTRLFTLAPHNMPASSYSLRLAVCFLLAERYVELPDILYPWVSVALTAYLLMQMLRDTLSTETPVDIFEHWNYEKGSHDEADSNSD